MDIERIVPGTKEWEAYYANHVFRYQFAAEQIANPSKVLDAACGVGYGTQFLAKKFYKHTTGVDISEDALRLAKKYFLNDNVNFVHDDVETLTKVNGQFSHIVSFETFEHLKHPENFLKRAYELLSDDGTLIMSTPNAAVTSPDRKVDWTFHEKEYMASELIEIVQSSGFSKTRLYGQSYSSLGKMRNEFRKELHRLHHNPFIRLGKWIQKKAKGIDGQYAVLPEQLADFELNFFNSAKECEELGMDGSFVLMIIAEK